MSFWLSQNFKFLSLHSYRFMIHVFLIRFCIRHIWSVQITMNFTKFLLPRLKINSDKASKFLNWKITEDCKMSGNWIEEETEIADRSLYPQMNHRHSFPNLTSTGWRNKRKYFDSEKYRRIPVRHSDNGWNRNNDSESDLMGSSESLVSKCPICGPTVRHIKCYYFGLFRYNYSNKSKITIYNSS